MENGYFKKTNELENENPEKGDFGVERKRHVREENFSPKDFIKQKLIELYKDNNAEWAEEANQLFSESDLSRTFYDNADIFFNEIIKITEDNREKEPERTGDFLRTIHETFFGRSPNISNDLRLEDILIVSAKVNQVEELRGFVGQNMVGEFVYTISFAGENITSQIINKLESLPSGIREEVINQLEACFSNAIAQGEWAQTGASRIRAIIKHFAKSSRPLTRIISQVAEETCLEEEKNPSLGVVTYMDNKSGGKLNSKIDIVNVNKKINSNLPVGYRVRVVARDAIIGFDHAGMARFGVIEENAKNIESHADIGTNILKALRLIKDKQFFDIEIGFLINLLADYLKTFEPEKDVYTFYAEILALPKQEVMAIFDSGSDIRPFFHGNWDQVQNNILAKVEIKFDDLEDVKSIKFDSFNDLTIKNSINPFDIVNKDDVTLLSQCLRPEVQDHLKKELNISFSDISFRAQMGLLRFLSEENNDTYDRLCEVLKKFPKEKVSITETFVDCAKDIELGKKIISLCENIDINIVNKIFNKYLELIAQLNNVEKILAESYGKEGNREEILKIKDAILHKGKGLLMYFSDMLSEGEEISAEEIINHLQKIEAEATTFFLAFKTLKEEKQLPALEDIKGISFEEKSATEISSPDREIIKKMYSENYRNNPALLNELIAKFEKRIIDPKTRFYILKYGDKLRACIGFTPFEDKEAVYAHSFNVEDSLRGISIGNTMMEKAMDREASGRVIEADCVAYEKIGAKYIETGFIGTSFYLYNGNPSLSIARDEKNNSKYWGKQMLGMEKELMGIIQNEKLPTNVLVESANEQKNISMDALSKGYVLTRYFMDEITKKWHAVFEKIKK